MGSNSNVAENGLDEEAGRAAIWRIEIATGAKRVYASGLRNPNGMAFAPGTGTLWTVVNEGDEIGSDRVPDDLTSVRDGGFHGWPWSGYGAHADERVQPARPDKVAQALVPDDALGAHVAPLGLAAVSDSPLMIAAGGGGEGMFIGLHGPWNRRPLSGYKVVFVPFDGGQPRGMPIDVLTGFVDADGRARGRPVGVAIAADRSLPVAEDIGNAVWRVAPRP